MGIKGQIRYRIFLFNLGIHAEKLLFLGFLMYFIGTPLGFSLNIF